MELRPAGAEVRPELGGITTPLRWNYDPRVGEVARSWVELQPDFGGITTRGWGEVRPELGGITTLARALVAGTFFFGAKCERI